MNNILKQVNPSIADGVYVFASVYDVKRGSEAFEEAVDYILSWWYGEEKNQGLLATLPPEKIKSKTFGELNNRRKKELKHTHREQTFTDFNDAIGCTDAEESFISPEEYIEAGGTNIDELNNIIDKKPEKNAKGREVVGSTWIDTRMNDKDYLEWTALWTYYGTLPEKQQRYIRKHLMEKKKFPANKIIEDLGLPMNSKQIKRAERAFKYLKENANEKLNKWIENGALDE